MDGIGAEGLFNIRQNQPWIHRGIECIAQSVNDGLLVYMAQGRDIRAMGYSLDTGSHYGLWHACRQYGDTRLWNAGWRFISACHARPDEQTPQNRYRWRRDPPDASSAVRRRGLRARLRDSGRSQPQDLGATCVK